ncbi:MAG TPA: C39 family peptidase [Candidatus Dormibacteraeota bacterium]|jgi:uncharacterized protein YvpB|nr:C39 family peptidase [Candidatus Dormibacteraeota bacterium]
MPTLRRSLVRLSIAAAVASVAAGVGTVREVHAAGNLIVAPVLGQTHSLSCEAAALQIALAAKGIDVSQDWILAAVGADRRGAVVSHGAVQQWGDPYQTFVGNVDGSEPNFTGYGVYGPPIAVAAQHAGASAQAMEGVDPQVLYQHVLNGNPAVVWVVSHLGVTSLRSWTAWDGRVVPYSVGEHAMTLVGVNTDDTTVTLIDPETRGQFSTSMAKFESSFNSFGRMAVVVKAGYTGIQPTVDARGYLLPASDGSTSAFGNAPSLGSLQGQRLNRAVLGAARTPTSKGVWMTAADGGVFTLGDARFYGSMGAVALNQPVVGIAGTPSGHGYWLVASDGGIFTFGDAGFYGSTGAIRLNKPVVGMAATPSGHGYWLVASDGGVFSFGDAVFHGSTGNLVLNRPVVGMAPTPGGGGYWMVAADGGVFSFGNATFFGSMGGTALVRAITAMASTPDGGGYWMVAGDGGVFAFGDAVFYGSAG